MKRILSILISTVLVIGTFSGCGTKDSAYSKEEKQIIKEANQMISNEYAVDIDEDDFSYSVGKQISEKEFVPLDSEQKQEAAYLEEEDNALSTLKMQMEDFYVAEKDADILIYNGTIEGELNSVDELIAKNSLFADFKAVQSGDVYTTGGNFYQETSATCDFIEDLNKILTDSGDTDYRFIQKLK